MANTNTTYVVVLNGGIVHDSMIMLINRGYTASQLQEWLKVLEQGVKLATGGKL